MMRDPITRLFRRRRRRKSRKEAYTRSLMADTLDRTLFLQGQIAGRMVDQAKPLRDLSEAEFRVYSQWGEDGIIDWLVSHVAPIHDRFVEFGVETFKEANCRFLLRHRNWKGLVLDGSDDNMAALRDDPIYWMHDLTGRAAFVTAENIDELIVSSGFGGPLGVLSIDIDGNDYWVWRAIESVTPDIVVCEVNPIFGDSRAVTVPYDPGFRRFAAHSSGLYFGASIKALVHLGREKGFTFVGTNSMGINAFFVRDELAAPVLELLHDIKAFPPRHRDSRNEGGQLSFVGGTARFDLIRNMPVVDVLTGEQLFLRDLQQPYSEEWLKALS